jgi:hypothetical protein
LTTTGTYAFNPSTGELVADAFAQIGILRTDLTATHLRNASTALGLLMVDFSNRTPNRWAYELQTQVLSSSLATYTLTARTIAIAIAYISTTDSSGAVTDRVIGPISATDYASVANKATTAPPNAYWLNLTNPPTLTLWPTPDASTIYTLNMQTFRQMQDVRLSNASTVDAPFRFLEAVSAGLAWRLAKRYPKEAIAARGPNVMAELKTDWLEAFSLAAQTDQETTPLYITPGLSGYYR